MAIDRNRKTPVDPVAPLRIPHDRTPPRPPSPAEVERKKRETIDLYAARRRDTPPSSPQAPRPEPTPPSVSPDVDRALGRLLRAAAGKLWPLLAAGTLGGGGAVAYQRTTAPPERNARQDEVISSLRVQVRELQDEVSRLGDRERRWQRWAVEQQDWQLQLLERQGVRVRRPEGLPPPTPIETTAPLRRPGSVTPGPSLEVATPPPAPP